MPGPLVAGIAGSVGSALLQRGAARDAASAQGRAADAQIAESRRQFDLIQGLLRPYVNSGTTALQAQLDLMGIGGTAASTPEITSFFTGGTPGGTGSGSFTAGDILNGIIGGTNGISRPTGGTPGTPGVERFRVGDREFATRQEAEAFANSQRTPGMSAEEAQRAAIDRLRNGSQFNALVQQGEYGLLANQSATGGLRGGNTQAALAQFRPQMLQSLIDRQLANLGGIAANGQSAAAMTGTAAQNTAGMVNQALGDRGAAQAGAAIASGRGWTNALSDSLGTVASFAQPFEEGGGLFQRWRF
jgi:hypothetical protein